MENWNFWIPLTFIFCKIVRIVLQTWYVYRRGVANFWLNWQFSRKEMFIFMKQTWVKLSARNTVFKQKWGSKLPNFTRYPVTNINGSLNTIYCLLNLYIDIGTRYIPKMKKFSVYYWNQPRNNAEKKRSSLQ